MYESKQNGRNQSHVRSLIDKDDQHLAQLVAQKRFSRWLVQNQIFDIQIVSRALLETPAERLQVGSLAQLLGFLTTAQIEEIRRLQHAIGGSVRTVRGRSGLFDGRPAGHSPGHSGGAAQSPRSHADDYGPGRQGQGGRPLDAISCDSVGKRASERCYGLKSGGSGFIR